MGITLIFPDRHKGFDIPSVLTARHANRSVCEHDCGETGTAPSIAAVLGLVMQQSVQQLGRNTAILRSATRV